MKITESRYGNSESSAGFFIVFIGSTPFEYVTTALLEVKLSFSKRG